MKRVPLLLALFLLTQVLWSSALAKNNPAATCTQKRSKNSMQRCLKKLLQHTQKAQKAKRARILAARLRQEGLRFQKQRETERACIALKYAGKFYGLTRFKSMNKSMQQKARSIRNDLKKQHNQSCRFRKMIRGLKITFTGTLKCYGCRCYCKCSGRKEICDGKDNDCDGLIDNGLLAPTCSKQKGVCKGAKKRCGGEEGWLDCTDQHYKKYSTSYETKEKSCDKKDNDCDGQVDGSNICKAKAPTPRTTPPKTKPKPRKRACYTGPPNTRRMGICKDGTQLYENEKWGSCIGEVLPKTERCDGVDNNCDGVVDGLIRPCYQAPLYTKNVGSCKEGQQICKEGKWQDCEKDIGPEPEYCNYRDDDCDGKIDEGGVCGVHPSSWWLLGSGILASGISIIVWRTAGQPPPPIEGSNTQQDRDRIKNSIDIANGVFWGGTVLIFAGIITATITGITRKPVSRAPGTIRTSKIDQNKDKSPQLSGNVSLKWSLP